MDETAPEPSAGDLPAAGRAEFKARVRIRTAVVSDAATILTLIRELAEYEQLTHEVVVTEDLLQATMFGPQSATSALLAETDDGETVGTAIYFRTYSTFLGREGIYLEDLFVRPEYRGRGAGSQLLAAVAAEAAQLGGRLEWAVLDWNQSAIDVYESLGAVRHSEWLRYRLVGDPLAALAKRAEAVAPSEPGQSLG
ncbi:MAG: GNAT family N-acetyltransferase [Pirellulales bacterium]|nr:GNAT family N-acetyltransferase [Pirellulales bacterium]